MLALGLLLPDSRFLILPCPFFHGCPEKDHGCVDSSCSKASKRVALIYDSPQREHSSGFPSQSCCQRPHSLSQMPDALSGRRAVSQSRLRPQAPADITANQTSSPVKFRTLCCTFLGGFLQSDLMAGLPDLRRAFRQFQRNAMVSSRCLSCLYPAKAREQGTGNA
jgi:hypothetical protein